MLCLVLMSHERLSKLPLLYADETFDGKLAFVSVAPFFRTKDERIRTRNDKFFNKALKTLAGVNDTELRIARPLLGTGGFLPCIARIAPRTPRRPRPQLPVAMSRGRRPRRSRTMTMQQRPVASGSEDESEGGGHRSAQLFLLLSEIAW